MENRNLPAPPALSGASGHMPDDIEFELILGRQDTQEDAHDEEVPVMYGTPEEDMKSWEPNQFDKSGLLPCISMVIKQLSGRHYYHKDLLDKSVALGYGRNLSRNAIIEIIDKQDYFSCWDDEAGPEDLPIMLDSGEKVICGINSLAFSVPQAAELPGLRANKFVQLTGCETLSGEVLRVIVNDPEKRESAGMSIEFSRFRKAWKSTLVICRRWKQW